MDCGWWESGKVYKEMSVNKCYRGGGVNPYLTFNIISRLDAA